MTKIFLIRHAEADGNIYRRAHGHFDGKVTYAGHAQIECLRERFRNERIDAVYSSDLTRACTTAAALSEPRNLSINKTDMLREVNIGCWEDMAWGDIEHREPEMCGYFGNDPGKWDVPGSEGYADVQRRMKECIGTIGAHHDGGSVAVFSHGFAIRALMCELYGVASHETHKIPYCDNTAVSLLLCDNGELTVEYRGDNSHLSNDISTFAKQTWWRGDKGLIRENLRYADLTPEHDRGFLERYCEDVSRFLKTDMKSMVFLGDEPIGFMGLDASGGDAVSIEFLFVKPGEMFDSFFVQLIGQAAYVARKLGRKSLLVSEAAGDRAASLLSQHGFTGINDCRYKRPMVMEVK